MAADNEGMSETRILIVAHAPLAGALLQCALHVFPDSEQYLLALDVRPQADPQDSLRSAQELVQCAAPPGAPLLVLTDLFGATPANVAQELARRLAAQQRPATVVTGANLPMLLRAITYRHEPLETLAERSVSGGTRGIASLPEPAPTPSTTTTP